MKAAERFVLDTNTIISGALFAGSVPDQSVRLALRLGMLLFSLTTLRELIDVLKREKFDRYRRKVALLESESLGPSRASLSGSVLTRKGHVPLYERYRHEKRRAETSITVQD